MFVIAILSFIFLFTLVKKLKNKIGFNIARAADKKLKFIPNFVIMKHIISWSHHEGGMQFQLW